MESMQFCGSSRELPREIELCPKKGILKGNMFFPTIICVWQGCRGKVLFFFFLGMHFVHGRAPGSTHVWCILICFFIDDFNDLVIISLIYGQYLLYFTFDWFVDVLCSKSCKQVEHGICWVPFVFCIPFGARALPRKLFIKSPPV